MFNVRYFTGMGEMETKEFESTEEFAAWLVAELDRDPELKLIKLWK